MKRPPSLPKRRRPPDRPIEPEAPPQGPQQRNVPEGVDSETAEFPGFPGFPRAFSPAPREGLVGESAVGRPRPQSGSGAGRNAGVQGIFRLDPGKRTGEARSLARETGLWPWSGDCGALRAPVPGHAEPRPPRGKARGGRSLEDCVGILFGCPRAEAIKTARWDRPKRKWAGGISMRGKRPAEGFHGYRCKIAPGLRVPGCLHGAGMNGAGRIGKHAGGRGGKG